MVKWGLTGSVIRYICLFKKIPPSGVDYVFKVSLKEGCGEYCPWSHSVAHF